MKATKQLRDEHEGIKLMLNIMESISESLKLGKDLHILHYGKIIEFLKVFAVKCHHGKEEDILFPAMVARGYSTESGPISVMLNEHQIGRGYIKDLSSAVEDFNNGNKNSIKAVIKSSMNYVNLLRNHIEKENNVLFMMADGALNETEQSEIYDAFEILEVEKIGAGKHEEYHSLLKELKSIYLDQANITEIDK